VTGHLTSASELPIDASVLPDSPFESMVPTKSVNNFAGIESEPATVSVARWIVAEDPLASTQPTVDPHGPATDSINRSQNPTQAPAGSPEKSASASPESGIEYKLLKRVGQGGMGEVWSALQTTLNRPVAVKRLLPKRLREDPGLRGEAIEEFRREAMVAGRLEHPNIVPIHDLGADDQGLPLIAMKLVGGKNWADIIKADFEAMPAPDFLGKHLTVLTAVCNAVALAHDRGVVHRDIKPAQVMVGQFGEVLLMDWGLAIAWKDTTTEEAPGLPLPAPGRASNPAGTPALMAPEQTDSTADRIGPWTDVFLLGGTLYLLLTGSYPYQSATSQVSFVRAMAVEQERPEARKPGRWIPAELADIAMRALSPAPKDRYSSVEAFRQALSDWVTGAARRREAEALVEECVAALGTSLGSYAEFEHVLHRLDRARALWPDQTAVDALYAEAKQGYAALALKSRDLTLARVQALGVSDEPIRRDLLASVDRAEAMSRRAERQRQWAVRGVIVLLLALVSSGAVFVYKIDRSRLAEVAARVESDRQRERAERSRDEAESLIQYMVTDLVEKLRPIGQLDLLDAVLNQVDVSLMRREEAASSPEELMSKLALALKMSDVRASQGNMIAAESIARRGVDLALEMSATNPTSLPIQLNLGTAWNNLGDSLVLQGRLEESLEAYRKGMEPIQRLAFDFPDEPQWQSSLGNCRSRISDIQERRGDWEGAMETIRPNLDIYTRLLEWDPDDAQLRIQLSSTYTRIGGLHMKYDRYPEAGDAFAKAEALTRINYEESPNNAQLKREMASVVIRLANLAILNGDIPTAQRHLEESLGLYSELAEIDPTNRRWQREWAIALSIRSKLERELKQLEAALETELQSLQIHRRLVEVDPSNVQDRTDVAYSLVRVADMYRDLGDREQTIAYYLESLALHEDLKKLDTNVRRTREAANIHARYGRVLLQYGDIDGAEREAKIALEGLESLDQPNLPALKMVRDDVAAIAEARAKLVATPEP